MAEKLFMKGNEALAEGAVRAGCRFFAGYPITPQNEVPEYMSWRMPEVGGTFIQAESEVSAINMLYGACGDGEKSNDIIVIAGYQPQAGGNLVLRFSGASRSFSLMLFAEARALAISLPRRAIIFNQPEAAGMAIIA